MTFSKKTSAFYPWAFGKVVSTAFYVSKGKFPWKISVSWPNLLSKFSRKWAKKSHLFLKLSSEVLKNDFHVSMVTFWRIFFEKAINNFKNFFVHWAKISWLSYKKNSVRLLKTASYVSIGMFGWILSVPWPNFSFKCF